MYIGHLFQPRAAVVRLILKPVTAVLEFTYTSSPSRLDLDPLQVGSLIPVTTKRRESNPDRRIFFFFFSNIKPLYLQPYRHEGPTSPQC